MSERYSRVFTLADNLYCKDAPVLIAAGALLKDKHTGNILAQLKFKSIDTRNIAAVKVELQPLDVKGAELGETVSHQYLDLDVDRESEFGQKEGITFSDETARSFSVKSLEVLFAGGTVWESGGLGLLSLGNQVPLDEWLDDSELAKQYRIEYGDKCSWEPREECDLWQCACGAFNSLSEEVCHLCGVEYAVLKAFDKSEFEKKKELRLAKERKEKDLEATKEKKRRRSVVGIASIVVSVLLIGTAIYFFAIEPDMLARSVFPAFDGVTLDDDLSSVQHSKETTVNGVKGMRYADGKTISTQTGPIYSLKWAADNSSGHAYERIISEMERRYGPGEFVTVSSRGDLYQGTQFTTKSGIVYLVGPDNKSTIYVHQLDPGR